ncbi:TonB-dependent receptor plug domain-containing protein [Sphingomonas echinoides]|uniref:TonB-dependent receptor n=1 Tax=Sphingomonas echinoides TaxID=59803 RepID=A0ABU4PPK0_9SPHN|nr:TonB-dependent receptor [Sphingomonas echinoides]MDX5986083.1 TonB-dependent receptor [Sphingomonas echinoides]
MKTLLSSAALAALLLPATAFAQVAPDPALAQTTDDESAIVVTGIRSTVTPLRADQIGGSVTVLDTDALDQRQTRTVSDILRDVPGVAVSRIPGQTQIRLRGAEANHTLVLIDGIEVSDPYAGEFDFGTLIADDVARVEVLRGQQSSIYGSDAIGGVIQYITLTGREAPGVSARIEGGSSGTVNSAARIAGVSGTFDYALSGTLNTTDGTPNARGGTRNLGNDSGAVSFKSTWSPASNARLTAVARYARTQADFNDSDSNPASKTFGYTIDTPGAHFINEAIYGLLRGELDLLDGKWTQALTGQIADTTRNGYGATARTYGDTGQRLKGSYESTLKLNQGALHHQLTVAVDVERERYRNTDPTGFAFTGRRQVDNVGIVGQYDLTLGEHAAFGASLRQDLNNRFQDTTTYRVQGSYCFDSGTRVRAAAGSGVKNPGFYELYGYSDGRFIGNPGLKPERSEGWEAGIEQSFDQGHVLIGATYFDSRLSDEIYTIYPAPTYVATPANRTTKSRQHGVEAFLNARIGTAWRIDAAYTYLHARENGVEEVRRPSHIASVAVGWRAPHDRFGFTAVARYNGDTSDVAFTDPSYVPVTVRLHDYVLLNLNGDVKLTKHFTLFGRIENLNNAHYEDVFSFTNPGRTVYGGVRARF